jgi:hypothetical protein
MEDIIFDTHGAYSTSTAIYTCPVAGKYRITASAKFESGAGNFDGGEIAEFRVYKNGSFNRVIAQFQSYTSIGPMGMQGSGLFSCVAGDTLEVRAYQNTGGAKALDTAPERNWVSYERIGN